MFYSFLLFAACIYWWEQELQTERTALWGGLVQAEAQAENSGVRLPLTMTLGSPCSPGTLRASSWTGDSHCRVLGTLPPMRRNWENNGCCHQYWYCGFSIVLGTDHSYYFGKYTEHRIDHFNHFQVCRSEALSTFPLLCNRHHHPSPELFIYPNKTLLFFLPLWLLS